MKKILVTGGCGFIGSHLVERLLKEGHRVTVIDNLCTGKTDNLKAVLTHPCLELINVDICDRGKISPYFRDKEWVFHLAALADIVPSIEKPENYFSANVQGTFNVIEACRKAGIKKFIYTASSSCYGLTQEYPTSENARIQPEYPYALTKMLGEQIALHWGHVYGLEVISLRLFNVYGPRARSTGQYGAVFGVFLAQKLAKKPLTVVGDGSQKRDFVYVCDVVEAFLLAAKSNYKNEIFNVGYGDPKSIHQLTQLLDHPVTYIPKRPGEPECTWADISKIKKYLNWQPKVTFEEGVSELLKQIELWRQAPVWTPLAIERETQTWFKYLNKDKT